MTIQLEKKKPFDLTKREPGLARVLVGLSWDNAPVNGVACDCDASVFMLNATNRIPGEGYFVFYNNLKSEDTAVLHKGDNRDGTGDGDDEVIDIDLPRVNADVVQMLFAVTIHESEKRGHNFGNVKNAAIRVLNPASNAEICRFDLSEQFGDADSLVIGRLFRDGSDWKFEAMGDSFGGGLGALVELYS